MSSGVRDDEADYTKQRTSQPSRQYTLHGEEETVLLAMASRYLRFEAGCQPLTYHELVDYLTDLPGQDRTGWSVQKLQRIVRQVRMRLDEQGVPGMTSEDYAPNLGNSLNHALIVTLMQDGALSAEKLDRLDRNL